MIFNEETVLSSEIVGEHNKLRLGETLDVNIFGSTWYSMECVELIDLGGFDSGTVQKNGTLDVTRSNQFSETNRGLTEKFKDKRFVTDLMNWANGNVSLSDKLNEILKTGCLSPLKMDEVNSTVLYHSTGIKYKSLGFFPKQVDNLEVMRKSGVYGSKNRVTYVTRDFERAIAHSPKAAGSDILLLVLNTKKLMEYRNIFPDPESLSMRNEFLRNFAVPHGLPVGSIVEAYHLISKGERK